MKIIKSVKELPSSEYTLPNNCPVCGKYTGLYWLSKYIRPMPGRIDMEKNDEIRRIAERLHNAGLNAYSYPHNVSYQDWYDYRYRIAEELYKDGIRIKADAEED